MLLLLLNIFLLEKQIKLTVCLKKLKNNFKKKFYSKSFQFLSIGKCLIQSVWGQLFDPG